MSTIKIYTATPADLSPPVQSESFCVDLVLASDYRELEAKCAALAAENAGLKKSLVYVGLSPKYGRSAMMDMKKPFIDKLLSGAEYYSVCGYISAAANRAICAVHGDYSWMPETPATDAFLAEVRAEVIEWLDAEISAIDPVYRGDPSYEHDAYWMKGRVRDLIQKSRESFAAQLRQGAKS
ncbi:TPA: hypothetical protein G9B33_001656 [Salmonella enterica]|uniref:Uncharacterized protein n=1 Tax=Salmonella enterica TaxID=28901 RepID=A0A743CA15_SALER|nr:hypothetical protein [Salmonella enterica]